MDNSTTALGGILLSTILCTAACASSHGVGPKVESVRQTTGSSPESAQSESDEDSARSADTPRPRVGGDGEGHDGSSPSDEAGPDDAERAVHWAKRNIDASRNVAHGAGIRETAERFPDLFKQSKTDIASPNGRWSRGTLETEEPTTASTTSSGSTSSDAPSDAGSLGWPVGFPESGGGANSEKMLDPRIEAERFDLDDESQREKVADRFGIDPPEAPGAVAIRGTFAEKLDQYGRFDRLEPEQLDNQVMVVVPGERVTLYAGSTEIDTLDFPNDVELPETLRDVHPVRVVRDETAQILLYWARPDPEADAEDDGEGEGDSTASTQYRVAVLKAIGPRIGTVFERTIGVSADGEEIERSGYVEFLTGDKHRTIRWIPADAAGDPSPGDALRLEWNKWEGVFRRPGPPPTAPDNQS